MRRGITDGDSNESLLLEIPNFNIPALLQPLMTWATSNLVIMLLVCARVAGMVVVGPVFGQGIIPGRLRAPLVLVVSLFITTLTSATVALPAALIPTDSQILSWSIAITPVLINEFLLGFAISMGVLICLSGLQLAGLLIDRQSGIAVGTAYDPTMSSQSSVTGRFLVTFGLVVFILLEPIGGHERMLRSLVESFRAIPPGSAAVDLSMVELLSRLVHESLQLAVQFAAPAVAAVSLVALTTNWLQRSLHGVPVMSGYPVRALLNLVVLAASLSGVAGVFAEHASDVLDRLVRMV